MHVSPIYYFYWHLFLFDSLLLQHSTFLHYGTNKGLSCFPACCLQSVWDIDFCIDPTSALIKEYLSCPVNAPFSFSVYRTLELITELWQTWLCEHEHLVVTWEASWPGRLQRIIGFYALSDHFHSSASGAQCRSCVCMCLQVCARASVCVSRERMRVSLLTGITSHHEKHKPLHELLSPKWVLEFPKVGADSDSWGPSRPIVAFGQTL